MPLPGLLLIFPSLDMPADRRISATRHSFVVAASNDCFGEESVTFSPEVSCWAVLFAFAAEALLLAAPSGPADLDTLLLLATGRPGDPVAALKVESRDWNDMVANLRKKDAGESNHTGAVP